MEWTVGRCLRRCLPLSTVTQKEILAECRAKVVEDFKTYRMDRAFGPMSPLIGKSIQKLMLKAYDNLIESFQLLPFDPNNLQERKFTDGNGGKFKQKMTRGFYRRGIDAAELFYSLQKDPQVRDFSSKFKNQLGSGITVDEANRIVATNITCSLIGRVIETAVAAGYLPERMHGVIHPVVVPEFAEMMQYLDKNNRSR